MRLKRLTLKHFRNIASQALTLSPRLNILLGQNGQGKTNILEAVYTLSNARSNRTGQDRELIQHGELMAGIEAEVTPHAYEGYTVLAMQWRCQPQPGDETATRLQTTCLLNDKRLKSRSELLGYLPSVSFFLSDLQLLRGAPDDRRRWLDTAVTQWDHQHLKRVSAYQRIRQQKSQLLKQPPHLIDATTLGLWNEQLAQAGAALTAARLRYLAAISPCATMRHQELTGVANPAAEEAMALVIHYQANHLALPEIPTGIEQEELAAQLQPVLLAAMTAREADERRRATCLVGPHRDDLRFWMGEDQIDVETYGSQGQQRTVVLAVKLAEWALLQHSLGEPPLLLLDDVMAELDPLRQRYLVEHIDPHGQVILTTTHLDDALKTMLMSWMAAGYQSGETDHPVAIFQVSRGQVQTENTMPPATERQEAPVAAPG
ncbi:MAG: DNA replication/repair protein RecF [Candidatus Melainabacteria bacterium]